MKHLKLVMALLFVTCWAWAPSGEGTSRQESGAGFGDPLPGLSAEQMALFLEGKEDFEEIEEVADGLGPVFNARGCAECHAVPVTGGSGITNEVRVGFRDVDGTFRDVPGGSLIQIFSVAPDRCQERIPAEANVVAFRQVQPLFGIGLIEAIPEEAIVAQADPEDRDGDGISGRAARVLDLATNRVRLGRFGWKAQQASLLGFAGDAYLNEMGITNDLAREENPPNGDMARLAECDSVADPEDVPDPMTGRRGIDNFVNFMQLLGPPPRGPITEAVRRGEQIFTTIGCARCHTPAFQTGDHPIAALSRKTVPLYSDLLLHDVGTGDGIPQGDAGPTEFRTPPLWGLRMSRPFLHDGSAATIEEAIRRHAGEARRVTERFLMLTPAERADLLAFLESL
ncbi:MAG TPA: di-heme oxidoredictase family protein [Blastocatellia bacterium]|nr:di-heme oxidoredictase family protein [Blastocatellia bacterium]